MKQPTVREINAHEGHGRYYVRVYDANGLYLMRITRARTRKGVLEGRQLAFSGCDWRAIPTTATIRLEYY
jgi:hypothetical protein